MILIQSILNYLTTVHEDRNLRDVLSMLIQVPVTIIAKCVKTFTFHSNKKLSLFTQITNFHFSLEWKTFTFQLMNDHPASLVPAFDSKVIVMTMTMMTRPDEDDDDDDDYWHDDEDEGMWKEGLCEATGGAVGKDKRKFLLELAPPSLLPAICAAASLPINFFWKIQFHKLVPSLCHGWPSGSALNFRFLLTHFFSLLNSR